MKGTGRPLNAFVAGLIGSILIPAYFLRLMTDGRRLREGLRDRRSFELDVPRGAVDRALD